MDCQYRVKHFQDVGELCYELVAPGLRSLLRFFHQFCEQCLLIGCSWQFLDGITATILRNNYEASAAMLGSVALGFP